MFCRIVGVCASLSRLPRMDVAPGQRKAGGERKDGRGELHREPRRFIGQRLAVGS